MTRRLSNERPTPRVGPAPNQNNRYTFYCNHFDTASRVFTTAFNKSKKFAKFIDEAVPRMGFTVQSIMISPIQRIPRYLLLLKEMLRHTGPEHPDAAPLAEALQNMGRTASDLNRSLSLHESALELFCVVTKFRPIPELEQPTPGLARAGSVEEETSGPRLLTLVLLKNGTMLLGAHGSGTTAASSSLAAEKERRQYLCVCPCTRACECERMYVCACACVYLRVCVRVRACACVPVRVSVAWRVWAL